MKKEEKIKTSKSIEKKGNIKKKNEVVSEKKTTKKENIFKVIARYFKGVVKEVKRIKWTSGKELVKYSIAAIVFVVFFGLYFYGIDWIALLVRSLAK
jgi:preprotein translocase SecE subunit